MIKIFYGDDRVKAQAAIKKLLGDDYEVIESENLLPSDMASVFYGGSLFSDERKILIKDLSANKDCWEELPKYLDSSHAIILLEAKIDKRSSIYKELSKNKAIEFKEFKLPEILDKYAAFGPFDAAYNGDIKMAILKASKLEEGGSDPYSLIGLMGTQACKKLSFPKEVARAKEIIKMLAETDTYMKTTGKDGWELVKIALMKIAATK